jgi:hypothetical protein
MAFTQFPEQPKSPLPSQNALVETSSQIQRTMVVGLGGTGGEIIKRLKRRLRRQGQATTYIRFLSLDTDVRTWLASLQFPALEPKERVPLHYPNPENVLSAPYLYPTIQHLFHQGRRVDISLLADGSGAGLMPVVGRAAFHLNAPQVYNNLQRALRDLQAMPAQPGGQPLTEEYRIYVCGSVAGGTGAGAFLETAVLIRHVFNSLKFRLIGVAALPEAFAPTLRGQQLDAQSRGNAYAVLKELQYLQDGPVHWNDPETFTFQYQLGGDVRTITLNERPFHILYVVDNQNQHGGALRNLTDIYEMVAQQLSVEIGSPFGSKFASAQANDRAIMGLAPCPETQRPANISSLATAALVVPEEKLTRYCARRYLREVLRERLLGAPALASQKTEQTAAAWLMAAGLEERGAHRMISRAVLTDLKEAREVTGAEFALDPEAMADRSVPEFLAALAGQEDHFTAQALPQIRAAAERNLERLRAELPARAGTMLEEAFAAGGVRGALAARAAVERELTGMSAALAARQNEDETVRAEVGARLAEAQDELQRKAGLLGRLFGKTSELKHKVCKLQADVMQVELDMLARTAAMRLVEAARGVAEEQRRRLEGLEGQLVRLQSTVDAEVAQEQWAPDQGSAYALETEVIRADHFPAYYDRFRPSSPELFLAEVAGEGGYLSRLAGREYPELSGLLTQAARTPFVERVEKLNVVEVLGELYDRTDAFHLLDDLARRCQPFWTASPRGAGAFSDVFLIGSPGLQTAAGGPVKAEPLLQEWVDQHAGGSVGGLYSSPTYVALGNPGAIIFSRQTHGARLHYMRQILDYQEHYRLLQQQRGYPVHFKPALEALPELRPDDEKATEAWSLGVAYGMVALKDFGWVWALDSEQRKDPEVPGAFRTVEFLRTSSVWDLAAEIAPVETREVAPHSSRFLHPTRSGALGQFSQRREFITTAERKVRQRLDLLGKQLVGAELTRYLEEVLGPRSRRAEELEAATLTKEYAAIRRYLDRLNL